MSCIFRLGLQRRRRQAVAQGCLIRRHAARETLEGLSFSHLMHKGRDHLKHRVAAMLVPTFVDNVRDKHQGTTTVEPRCGMYVGYRIVMHVPAPG